APATGLPAASTTRPRVGYTFLRLPSLHDGSNTTTPARASTLTRRESTVMESSPNAGTSLGNNFLVSASDITGEDNGGRARREAADGAVRQHDVGQARVEGVQAVFVGTVHHATSSGGRGTGSVRQSGADRPTVRGRSIQAEVARCCVVPEAGPAVV